MYFFSSVVLVALLNGLICFGFQPRSCFLQFLVGWQICHLETNLQYRSCYLYVLIAIKVTMKKLRLIGMLLQKNMLLCCYNGEEHVLEHTLDCHIHFEILVETFLRHYYSFLCSKLISRTR